MAFRIPRLSDNKGYRMPRPKKAVTTAVVVKSHKKRKPKPPARLTANAKVNRYAPKTGFPNSMFAKLTYQDRIPLVFSASGFDIHEFRMNSLYDPDKTTTGHQPRYYDQYTALYQGYVVYGMKIEIQGFTKDTSREAFHLGMYPVSSTASVPSNYNDIVERGIRARKETKLSNENPVSKVIKSYFRPHLAQGVPKRVYNTDDQYAAGIGASPAVAPRVIIYGQTMDSSTATQGIDVNVVITYFCKFFDRKLPSQS